MLCQCPKLTPLQSRLLASLSALALLLLIYWTLSHPQFAYAAELAVDGSGQLRDGQDHNWHRTDRDLDGDDGNGDSPLVRKAEDQLEIEDNDFANQHQAEPGSVTIWEYPNRLLSAPHADMGSGLPQEPESAKRNPGHAELRRREEGMVEVYDRQQTRTIYISANTCEQPTWKGTGTQDIAPPQLTLYVSTSSGNQRLGPNGNEQTVHAFDRGFVNASVSTASGDWYMAVAAPQLSNNFTGSWTYQLAVSIDDYFHEADQGPHPFLYLVDADFDSALLITDNLTNTDPTNPTYEQWMNMSPPYTMYAINNNLTGLLGMENSFCGLQTFGSNNSQILGSSDDIEGKDTHVQMGLITRYFGGKPKEQFYITQLNSSSQYRGFLVREGNSTNTGNGVVGGGGKAWGTGVNFTTKRDGNCQLMFNLTFCDEVAYAVPTNPSNETWQNFTNLQNWYDSYTKTRYDNFSYTLGQVACNTTNDAQYSLAKTCDDCAAAYKQWLCAVSIPRCDDFSNPAPHLQVRNVAQPFYNNASLLPDAFLHANYVPMSRAPTLPGSSAYDQTYLSSFATNRSRNPQIDLDIRPGPYKELLPCKDLCYALMQSCPSSLTFACPYAGRGLEASYGERAENGSLTCSYPGAVYYYNAGARGASARGVVWLVSAWVVLVWVWM